MAYPVAVYAADPPPRPRGGTGGAQIVEIDLYRSGRTRGSDSARRYDSYAEPQDRRAQDAQQAERVSAERMARGDRARRASQFSARYDSGDDRDEFIAETGRRRAPSSLRFAVQSIAQEQMPSGFTAETVQPALAAYALAARHAIPGGDPTAQNGQMLSLYA